MNKLIDIFDIIYGHGLGLNTLETDIDGINFISRTSLNNGVAGRVKIISGINPIPAGTITVALSGSVLESFVQVEPFYTAYHIFCLTPKKNMSIQEKLYYCQCIRANKYRYNYGRQANRTLKDILVPELNQIPDWVKSKETLLRINKKDADFAFEPFFNQRPIVRNIAYNDNLFRIDDLFDVIYGVNLELNGLEKDPNGINFVSRTSKNNGVSAKVKKLPNLDPIESGVLTVAAGGSVLETFVQDEPFYSGRDLYYLKPKIDLCLQEKLYYCMCIKANKYRYNYGRQANRTLKEILIPSPDHIPEWVLKIDINKEYITKLNRIISDAIIN